MWRVGELIYSNIGVVDNAVAEAQKEAKCPKTYVYNVDCMEERGL